MPNSVHCVVLLSKQSSTILSCSSSSTSAIIVRLSRFCDVFDLQFFFTVEIARTGDVWLHKSSDVSRLEVSLDVVANLVRVIA